MPRKFPNVMMTRFPTSGGSQGSPQASHRRWMIGSWLLAYLAIVGAACLSIYLGPKAFAAAWGAPPVVLFCGLTILGLLTESSSKLATVFLLAWVILCALAVALAVSANLGGG